MPLGILASSLPDLGPVGLHHVIDWDQKKENVKSAEKLTPTMSLSELLEGVRFQMDSSIQISTGGQIKEAGITNPIHFHF